MRKFEFIFVFFIFFFASCEKENTISGIIIQDFELNKCLIYVLNCEIENEIIINSDSLYNNFISSHSELILQTCGSYEFPDINFELFDLLGKYTNVRGKLKYFEREVIKDEINLKYIYNIYIYTKKEYLRIEVIDYNWILVPKIPDNYIVEFNVYEN